jgi:hypothetical protein
LECALFKLAYGWEIFCSSGFEAVWGGDVAPSSVRITADQGTIAPAISHFGHGVLTFHVPCLFQTDQGNDLMVQGPVPLSNRNCEAHWCLMSRVPPQD